MLVPHLVRGRGSQQTRRERPRQNPKAAGIAIGEGATQATGDAAHVGLTRVHCEEHHPQEDAGVSCGVLKCVEKGFAGQGEGKGVVRIN